MTTAIVCLLLLAQTEQLYGQENKFITHIVVDHFKGANAIQVVDLDKDGDYDVIGGSEHTPNSVSKGILWWRNDGGVPIRWTEYIVDETFHHVMSLDVADINGDTFPDIVATSWENGRVTWWENNGQNPPDWTPHNIKTGWTNAHDAVCYDMNQDGKMDVVAACAGLNTISVFYQEGEQHISWRESVVSSDFGHAVGVKICDLNHDNYPDIVGCGDGCNTIAWWENNQQTPVRWIKKIITDNFYGVGETCVADINLDGQEDVVATAWKANQIAYWTCEDIATNQWRKTHVKNNFTIANNVAGGDFDLDGDIDLVATGKIPGRLSLFRNQNQVLREEILNGSMGWASGLETIDFDKDGDLDFFVGDGETGEILFYENLNASGVPKESNSTKINIYPNPGTGFVNLALDTPVEQWTVKVFTLQGTLITEEFFPPQLTPSKHKLHLQPGSYLLFFSTKTEVVVRKALIL